MLNYTREPGSRAYVKSHKKENDLRLAILLVSGLSTQNVTWISSVSAAKNLSLIADNKFVVYSDTAGDSVTIGDRTATRNSSEPVIWITQSWLDSVYFGWMCIGLSESAVKLTAKTEYAGSNIYKIVSHGVTYYVGSMNSQIRLDSGTSMCVKTSRFTVNVPVIESSIFRYSFQSTDYTDDSFFDKIVSVSRRYGIEEGVNMSCIKSIQKGYFSTNGQQTLGSVSVEINEIDPKKAFVILNTVGSNTYDPNQCGHAGLDHLWSTEIEIWVQAPATYTTLVTWQVIEFA